MVLKAPRSSVKFIPQRHSHGGRCWAGRGGDTAMLALGPKHDAPETQDSQAAFVRQGAYIFIQSASGGKGGPRSTEPTPLSGRVGTKRQLFFGLYLPGI